MFRHSTLLLTLVVTIVAICLSESAPDTSNEELFRQRVESSALGQGFASASLYPLEEEEDEDCEWKRETERVAGSTEEERNDLEEYDGGNSDGVPIIWQGNEPAIVLNDEQSYDNDDY